VHVFSAIFILDADSTAAARDVLARHVDARVGSRVSSARCVLVFVTLPTRTASLAPPARLLRDRRGVLRARE